MNEFVHANQAVGESLGQNFIIMKVTYTNEKPNEEFLQNYPDIPGYPHLFVLASMRSQS